MLTTDVSAVLAKTDPVIVPTSETDSGVLRQGLVPNFGTGKSALNSAFSPGLNNAVVMMVDDEATTIEIIRMFLEDLGFQNFLGCSDAIKAIEIIGYERPDVLLLDVKMPDVDGFEILSAMRADTHLSHIPVVMLTSATDSNTKLKALELGATDLLTKPVDPSELEMRLLNTLAAKAFQDQLVDHSVMLEHQVRLRTAELEAAQQHIIYCLAKAGEFRDNETGSHVARVGCFASIVARQLGFDPEWVRTIEKAAQLHDVGKIGISDTILLKKGRLTPTEFEQIKAHCEIGKRIIQPSSEAEWRHVTGAAEQGEDVGSLLESPVMQMAARIAETHQEKWDGSGYPNGLKGEEIPIEGRIVAVVDVYDALGSERPYKEAFPQEKCFAIIKRDRGTHFDPQVVDAFFAAVDEILQVQSDLAD